jgi:hypothetical protein
MADMDVRQDWVVFHRTGRRAGSGLEPVDPLALRPALFAPYRDLATLRYDFPLVLVDGDDEAACVQSLTGLVDDLVHHVAQGEAAASVTRHLRRQERQIRALAAEGEGGTLADLWDTAARQLGAGDEPLQATLRRARAALHVDGDLADCDRALPARVLSHAWRTMQRQAAGQFRGRVRRLIRGLSDILRTDFARSPAGRTAGNLRASIGTVHQDVFDFDVMSRLLAMGAPAPPLSDRRRDRIRGLIATLESQRFCPEPDRTPVSHSDSPHAFVFDRLATALAAYRERLPEMIALAKAFAIAHLEMEGTYQEATHDPFFDDWQADDIDPETLALFPDYLVLANVDALDPLEHTALLDILAARLPIKVLLQTDNILDDPSPGHADRGLGWRSRQLATMAVGLSDVYVMQASASGLFRLRHRVAKGIAYRGPALFSVFSGATETCGDLPPYLVAAAATESRTFPTFVFDPSGGSDWASRFDVRANPRADADWPTARLTYEDETHQRVTHDVAFTAVDFMACDRRFARHLAEGAHAPGLVPVSEALAAGPTATFAAVPYVSMVDGRNVLRRVLVDDKLMREASRFRDKWHSLQELGGIHNSHAERLIVEDRLARPEPSEPAASASTAPPVSDAAAPALPAPAADRTTTRSTDDPYIETPRCSTCNECTNLNNRMFAYNAQRQAYIADPTAGTFRQLVEAAESCQVSIIHPGKPRNPDEPGLDELIARAQPFQATG